MKFASEAAFPTMTARKTYEPFPFKDATGIRILSCVWPDTMVQLFRSATRQDQATVGVTPLFTQVCNAAASLMVLSEYSHSVCPAIALNFVRPETSTVMVLEARPLIQPFGRTASTFTVISVTSGEPMSLASLAAAATASWEIDSCATLVWPVASRASWMR